MPKPLPEVWESRGDDPERVADSKDPLIADLTGDARLPKEDADASDLQLLQERVKLSVNTGAKMMRAAHHAQTALNQAVLFECVDDKGKVIKPDKITSKDGVALQILKRLAQEIARLESVPLEEGETELQRRSKIVAAYLAMTKQQSAMEISIAKAMDLSSRASQKAAELSFRMKAHQDKMSLLKDKDLDAVEVERIADG